MCRHRHLRLTVSLSMRVHVEPDGVDESRLLGAEEIARSAQLQVLERDLVAGAKLSVVLEDGETSVRILVDRIGNQQVAAGSPVRAADAASELVELREAKCVRAVDEHRVRVRNVGPDSTIIVSPHAPISHPRISHHVLGHARALGVTYPIRARGTMPDLLGHPIDRLDPL